MCVGDLVRVINGSGCYEDGEATTCHWPESKDQVAVVLELKDALDWRTSVRSTVVTIEVLGEITEFCSTGLEVISEGR